MWNKSKAWWCWCPASSVENRINILIYKKFCGLASLRMTARTAAGEVVDSFRRCRRRRFVHRFSPIFPRVIQRFFPNRPGAGRRVTR
jgi:hypothetical protein